MARRPAHKPVPLSALGRATGPLARTGDPKASSSTGSDAELPLGEAGAEDGRAPDEGGAALSLPGDPSLATAVASVSGGDDKTLMFWLRLLEELEADLEGIEGLLGHEVGGGALTQAWQVPQPCPPIPEALIPRARMVLEKQLAAAHDVARRISATEAEMALMDKVRDTAMTHAPVYLDTQA